MKKFISFLAIALLKDLAVSAQPNSTTVVLASHDKTTATLTIDTSDSAYPSVQYQLLAYNCTDGTNQITGAECTTITPAVAGLSPAPYSVSWTGLIPGKQYGFEVTTLEYQNGSSTGNVSGINLATFCTTANPPGNLTTMDGSAVDMVNYTVINNTVGVNDGYVVKYAVWDGSSMFTMVGEDNNTGANYAEMGVFSGLNKGELYLLTALADDQCPEYMLSTENVTAYFQAGLDMPTTSLTLLMKDATKMCFIWQYTGAGSWNMVKIQLMQSGIYKGSYSKMVTMSPGTMCVTQSGADTNMEAEVHFSAGNEVTADGMTFTKYSQSMNNSFYNFSDFSVISSYSSDCSMDIENCTVNVAVDYSINAHVNYTYVNLNYTSGTTISESQRYNLTDCPQSGMTDYNCTITLYNLTMDEYDFNVHMMVYDDLFKTINFKRADDSSSYKEQLVGMGAASLLTMVFAIMATFN